MSAPAPTLQAFAGHVDLASASLGGRALLASDEFFAAASCLVDPKPAVFDPQAYTERGKLMDGWESRRKRVPGHDWCILALGAPGRIVGVDIDTSYFMGNHPPFASLEAACVPDDTPPEALRDQVDWTPILAEVPLQRGSHNLHAVHSGAQWTHLRLHIYPDGGVARLRVYGTPGLPIAATAQVDLASLALGARPLACSDMFFSPMENLLLPDPPENMGGGWETRRSRPPGKDWLILALAAPGTLEELVVDTAFFIGNHPDTVGIDALYWPAAPPSRLVDHPDWRPIVDEAHVGPDAEHRLPVREAGPWTHLRLRIAPDGGVARLRALGQPDPTPPAAADPLLLHLNQLDDEAAAEALGRCCGATRWVAAMVAARPFQSRTQLFGLAEHLWWHLGDGDWREAFTHHPRIGADLAQLRAHFARTADWSAGEQAGLGEADESTLVELGQGNTSYEARFGYIFIVCASGLTAAEMLLRLRARQGNTPANELRIAAGEQAKITRLRLEKLIP